MAQKCMTEKERLKALAKQDRHTRAAQAARDGSQFTVTAEPRPQAQKNSSFLQETIRHVLGDYKVFSQTLRHKKQHHLLGIDNSINGAPDVSRDGNPLAQIHTLLDQNGKNGLKQSDLVKSLEKGADRSTFKEPTIHGSENHSGGRHATRAKSDTKTGSPKSKSLVLGMSTDRPDGSKVQNPEKIEHILKEMAHMLPSLTDIETPSKEDVKNFVFPQPAQKGLLPVAKDETLIKQGPSLSASPLKNLPRTSSSSTSTSSSDGSDSDSSGSSSTDSEDDCHDAVFNKAGTDVTCTITADVHLKTKASVNDNPSNRKRGESPINCSRLLGENFVPPRHPNAGPAITDFESHDNAVSDAEFENTCQSLVLEHLAGPRDSETLFMGPSLRETVHQHLFADNGCEETFLEPLHDRSIFDDLIFDPVIPEDLDGAIADALPACDANHLATTNPYVSSGMSSGCSAAESIGLCTRLHPVVDSIANGSPEAISSIRHLPNKTSHRKGSRERIVSPAEERNKHLHKSNEATESQNGKTITSEQSGASVVSSYDHQVKAELQSMPAVAITVDGGRTALSQSGRSDRKEAKPSSCMNTDVSRQKVTSPLEQPQEKSPPLKIDRASSRHETNSKHLVADKGISAPSPCLQVKSEPQTSPLASKSCGDLDLIAAVVPPDEKPAMRQLYEALSPDLKRSCGAYGIVGHGKSVKSPCSIAAKSSEFLSVSSQESLLVGKPSSGPVAGEPRLKPCDPVQLPIVDNPPGCGTVPTPGALAVRGSGNSLTDFHVRENPTVDKFSISKHEREGAKDTLPGADKLAHVRDAKLEATQPVGHQNSGNRVGGPATVGALALSNPKREAVASEAAVATVSSKKSSFNQNVSKRSSPDGATNLWKQNAAENCCVDKIKQLSIINGTGTELKIKIPLNKVCLKTRSSELRSPRGAEDEEEVDVVGLAKPDVQLKKKRSAEINGAVVSAVSAKAAKFQERELCTASPRVDACIAPPAGESSRDPKFLSSVSLPSLCETDNKDVRKELVVRINLRMLRRVPQIKAIATTVALKSERTKSKESDVKDIKAGSLSPRHTVLEPKKDGRCSSKSSLSPESVDGPSMHSQSERRKTRLGRLDKSPNRCLPREAELKSEATSFSSFTANARVTEASHLANAHNSLGDVPIKMEDLCDNMDTKVEDGDEGVCHACGHLRRDPILDKAKLAAYRANYVGCLKEGRKRKHIADGHPETVGRAHAYVESALNCVQYLVGLQAAEKVQTVKGVDEYVQISTESIGLIDYVINQFAKSVNRGEDARDKRFLLLCLRLQSILYLHLFNVKKDAVAKYSKQLSEFFKTYKPVGCPGGTSIGSGRTTNTPSPGGSLASVGSAGSFGSSGSNDKGLPATTMTSVPVEMHDVAYKYHSYMKYLLYSHRLWDEADKLCLAYPEFVSCLSQKVGSLNFMSSMMHLVNYVTAGLRLLKEGSS